MPRSRRSRGLLQPADGVAYGPRTRRLVLGGRERERRLPPVVPAITGPSAASSRRGIAGWLSTSPGLRFSIDDTRSPRPRLSFDRHASRLAVSSVPSHVEIQGWLLCEPWMSPPNCGAWE
jgi:hypothetical protein